MNAKLSMALMWALQSAWSLARLFIALLSLLTNDSASHMPVRIVPSPSQMRNIRFIDVVAKGNHRAIDVHAFIYACPQDTIPYSTSST